MVHNELGPTFAITIPFLAPLMGRFRWNSGGIPVEFRIDLGTTHGDQYQFRRSAGRGHRLDHVGNRCHATAPRKSPQVSSTAIALSSP